MTSDGTNSLKTLQGHLAVAESVLDANQLLQETPGLDRVLQYYERSAPGYRWLHSFRGAIHMSLSTDGRFHRSDLCAHAQICTRHIDALSGRTVVEIGCGNGFNLAAIADRRSDINLIGIDVCRTNLVRASSRCRSTGIRLIEGDFHHLPLADDSVDVVLAVETLCYATEPAQVLSEVRRVLRPGGRLIAFDAYRTSGLDSLDPSTVRAVRLVEQSMALPDAQTCSEWLARLDEAGLKVLEHEDITPRIQPNLERFQRMAMLAAALPRTSEFFNRLTGGYLRRNAVAGILMPDTTGLGIHAYWETVAQKPTAASAGPDSAGTGDPTHPTPVTPIVGVSSPGPEVPSDVSDEHFGGYRTYHADFRCWVDQLVEGWRLPAVVIAAIVTALYCAVNLAIAGLGGVFIPYLTSPGAYVFMGGTFIGLIYINQSSRHIHSAIEEMRPIFRVTDDRFRDELTRRCTQAASRRGSLRVSVVVYAIYATMVFLAMFAHTFLERSGLIALRPKIVSPQWYVPPHIVDKTIGFLWAGLLPSLILGSGIWMMFVILKYLLDLRDWPVIPLTSVARMRLRHIVNLFMVFAMAWFVFEGLLALLFAGHFGNFFWVAMTVVALIGVVTALLPQFIFRRLLLRSYSDMCTWALNQLMGVEGRYLLEDRARGSWMGAFAKDVDHLQLHQLVEATVKPNLWVYDSEDLFVLGLGQAIAITAVLVQVTHLH